MMQNHNETEQALAAELRRLSDQVSDGEVDPAADLARARRSVRRSRLRLAGGSVLTLAALAVAVPFTAPAIGDVLPGNVNIRPAAYPTPSEAPSPLKPTRGPSRGPKPSPGLPSQGPAKPPAPSSTPSESPSPDLTPSKPPSAAPTPSQPPIKPTPADPRTPSPR